jgi:hypothetical protein
VHVPGCEQFPCARFVVELVERFIWEAHEFPPASARSAGNNRGGTRRITDLDVQRIEDAGVVEDDVDDEPVVEVAEVVHR